MYGQAFVVDACVIFDFRDGHILDFLFSPRHELTTPDVLAEEELLSPSSHELRKLSLRVSSLPGRFMEDVFRLREDHPGLSLNDALVVLTARLEGKPILSNNWHLKEAAEAEGIEVIMTLQLIDKLVKEEIIQPFRAIIALEMMLKEGRKLPRQESFELIQKWEKLLKQKG